MSQGRPHREYVYPVIISFIAPCLEYLIRKETEQSIRRLQEKGVKINPNETVLAWSVPRNGTSEYPPPPDGKPRPEHMWIETGNEKAGLQHMTTEKKTREWATQGIPSEKQAEMLPLLAKAWTTSGRHIGYQGKGTGRPKMAVALREEGVPPEQAKIYRGAYTAANNGFGVGMNTISSAPIKPAPATDKTLAIPGDVRDETLQNLYYYPPKKTERSASSPPDPQSYDEWSSRAPIPPRADLSQRASSMPPEYHPPSSSSMLPQGYYPSSGSLGSSSLMPPQGYPPSSSSSLMPPHSYHPSSSSGSVNPGHYASSSSSGSVNPGHYASSSSSGSVNPGHYASSSSSGSSSLAPSGYYYNPSSSSGSSRSSRRRNY
ncbi:hypothetical protein VTJ49DRAFT_4060 [Mycothermus thermophilus]|uniref:Uncharacterized protein n=1 Tax=Humicola insolens TaxID=85995 RepID=A0ABR3V684_HUMIN